ncbi:MAG TPA: hypothetical protein VHN19_11185 [Burkholderiales bacterium]|jgi:hypothetical protein|nr:hypothetical protein [Burkholderiales bacterium]HEX2650490.1 hypothetical protein [Burkholderiales bacterium]
MAPEQKERLLARAVKRRREQERAEIFARSMRLIAEAQVLRAKALDLQDQAAALIANYKRDLNGGDS